jgi:hypothetical protein
MERRPPGEQAYTIDRLGDVLQYNGKNSFHFAENGLYMGGNQCDITTMGMRETESKQRNAKKLSDSQKIFLATDEN